MPSTGGNPSPPPRLAEAVDGLEPGPRPGAQAFLLCRRHPGEGLPLGPPGQLLLHLGYR
jgi:hypothetical protein